MDFGDFENRNADEMYDDTTYRAWVDGGCLGLCPNGEATTEFTARVCEGFRTALRGIPADARQAFFVVHGGVIMAIMSHFARPEISYYDAWVKNCAGYVCTPVVENDKLILTDVRRIACAAEAMA